MDCFPSDPNQYSKSPMIRRSASTTPTWPDLPRRTTKAIQDRTGPPHDATRDTRSAARDGGREDPHRTARLQRDGVDDGSVADRAVLRDRFPPGLPPRNPLDRRWARLGLFLF